MSKNKFKLMYFMTDGKIIHVTGVGDSNYYDAKQLGEYYFTSDRLILEAKKLGFTVFVENEISSS